MGKRTKEELPEEVTQYGWNLAPFPDDDEGRQAAYNFLWLTEWHKAPENVSERFKGIIKTKDEIVEAHPEIIPYVVSSSDWSPRDGYAPKTPEEMAIAISQGFERYAVKQYGPLWRDISTPLAYGGKAGGILKKELKEKRADINAHTPGKDPPPQWMWGSYSGDWLIENLPGGPEAITSDDRAMATLISSVTGKKDVGTGEYDWLTNDVMPAVEAKQWGDYVTAAEKPDTEKNAHDWQLVTHKPENLAPWEAAWTAVEYWDEKKDTEQGPTTSFSSRKGRPYAYELDNAIAVLRAQYGDEWYERWKKAQGPTWVSLKAARVGLDNPDTKDAWAQTYDILEVMTNKMKDAKNSKERGEFSAEAQAQIDKLKAENDKFAKEIEELNKSVLKPTTGQLKNYFGDSSFATRWRGSRSGGGYRRRRGVRGGRSRKRRGSRMRGPSVKRYRGRRRKARL